MLGMCPPLFHCCFDSVSGCWWLKQSIVSTFIVCVMIRTFEATCKVQAVDGICWGNISKCWCIHQLKIQLNPSRTPPKHWWRILVAAVVGVTLLYAHAFVLVTFGRTPSLTIHRIPHSIQNGNDRQTQIQNSQWRSTQLVHRHTS